MDYIYIMLSLIIYYIFQTERHIKINSQYFIFSKGKKAHKDTDF